MEKYFAVDKKMLDSLMDNKCLKIATKRDINGYTQLCYKEYDEKKYSAYAMNNGIVRVFDRGSNLNVNFKIWADDLVEFLPSRDMFGRKCIADRNLNKFTKLISLFYNLVYYDYINVIPTIEYEI